MRIFCAFSRKNDRTNVAIRETVWYNTTEPTGFAAEERGDHMAKLTKMQQKIYDYIAETTRQQGYPPSVREIGEAVGLRSPSTVHFHLKHMEELGVLTKGAGKGRALTLAPLDGASSAAPAAAEPAPEPETPAGRVPIVGTVAAGSPILAQECIEDYLTFDTNGREGEYFALRVRGESMLNAGILPGDLVVVHQQPVAHNGEIVVVLLDEHGKEMRSLEFAEYMKRKMNTVNKRLVFIIGGPYGFSEKVYQAAHEKISMSKMTFSHQMIRLIFVEQIYRAMTILNGGPYHHE